jgi:hypothetical protein
VLAAFFQNYRNNHASSKQMAHSELIASSFVFESKKSQCYNSTSCVPCSVTFGILLSSNNKEHNNGLSERVSHYYASKNGGKAPRHAGSLAF